MEREGREGIWEKGEGTFSTSKQCFAESLTLSLDTSLTKLQSFLGDRKAEWGSDLDVCILKPQPSSTSQL